MSSRRSRLSLVRRSESPKSPIGDRTRSSLDISVDSRCSTPLNSRKRTSTFNDDADGGSPIIPMSQDTSNTVTGVSWAWNSPKRPILTSDNRVRPKPLANRNIISSKDPEFTRAQRKKNIEKLTGFNKFKSDYLKLLEESDEREVEQKDSCSSLKVCPPTSPPPSPDSENMFMSVSLLKNTKDTTPSKKKRPSNSSPFFKPASEIQSDSFNDSELDDLLLQATQAFEGKTEPPQSNQPGKASAPAQPEKRRSLIKSRTADDIEALLGDNTLGDEEFDFLLAEASQKLETEAINMNNPNSDNASSLLSSKRSGILTRHKSMPESPSQKVNKPGEYRLNSSKWSGKNLHHSPISVKSSSSDDSVMLIPPPKNDVITVSSSGSSSTIASRGSTASAQQQPIQKCTKEEIEQKRQEALKRQASRLKRLMQGNHS